MLSLEKRVFFAGGGHSEGSTWREGGAEVALIGRMGLGGTWEGAEIEKSVS